MTVARAREAARARGIYFDGVKRWRNNTVGYAYEFFTPNGTGFRQSDTLNGIYRQIMMFDKLG